MDTGKFIITLIARYLRPGLTAILFIYLLFNLSYRSHQMPIHGDEFHFINRTVSLQYFLEGRFGNPWWQGVITFDQPKFAEYFWGAVLIMNGKYPLDKYLASLGFTRRNLCCSDISGWQLNISGIKPTDISKVPQNISGAEPVLILRRIGVAVSFLALIIVYLTGILLSGPVFGLAAVILIAGNPLYDVTLRVMADGLLLLFLLVHFYISLLCVRQFTVNHPVLPRILFAGLMVIGSLAAATKLNGAFAVVYTLVLILYLGLVNNRLRNALNRIIITVYTTGIIFILLHPFLWSDPVPNGLNMLLYFRLLGSEIMQQRFPADALPDISSRLQALYIMVFSGQGFGYFHRFTAYRNIPVDLVLFLSGLVIIFLSLYFSPVKKRRGHIIWLIWTIIIIMGISLNAPLKWDRYYFPVIIAATLVQAYFIADIMNIIYTSVIFLYRKAINNSVRVYNRFYAAK